MYINPLLPTYILIYAFVLSELCYYGGRGGGAAAAFPLIRSCTFWPGTVYDTWGFLIAVGG